MLEVDELEAKKRRKAAKRNRKRGETAAEPLPPPPPAAAAMVFAASAATASMFIPAVVKPTVGNGAAVDAIEEAPLAAPLAKTESIELEKPFLHSTILLLSIPGPQPQTIKAPDPSPSMGAFASARPFQLTPSLSLVTRPSAFSWPPWLPSAPSPTRLDWVRLHLPLYASDFIEDHDPEWRDLVE